MITLADLLTAMDPAEARLIGSPIVTQFDGFAYDSRKLSPGELFLAVRTARADGHEYVVDAIRRGAAGVLGDRLTPDFAPGVTTIAVRDTLEALRAWARYVLARYTPTVVGFVGSTGKSLAAKATVSLLGYSPDGVSTVFDGDYHNTLYGLPIALGQLTSAHRLAVLELAGEEPGDLHELVKITRPSTLVVVRGFDHPAAATELTEAVSQLSPDSLLILNAMDARIAPLAGNTNARVLRYGCPGTSDVWADQITHGFDSTDFVLTTPEAQAQVRISLIGEPGLSGALAAATVALSFGYDIQTVATLLGQVRRLPGRLSVLPGVDGSVILDDTFNAGRPALSAALAALQRHPGRKFVALGELARSDRDSSDGFVRQIGRQIADCADGLVTLGPSAEAIGLAAIDCGVSTANVAMTDSANDAAQAIQGWLRSGDGVLVIGGADARMEGVAARLLASPSQASELLVRQDPGWKQRVFLSRERPTWVEIDLRAIGNNVSHLKAIASPAAFMAVLKADAYGHGAIRVARTALLNGADYLATACLSEALALRQHGISAPILILGFTPPWQASEITRHGLTATVFSLDQAHHLSRAALAFGRGPVRIQIKVDTGMGRLGLLPADVLPFVRTVRALPGLDLEGIFTHFAQADAEDPEPTYRQMALFNEVLTALATDGWQPRYAHAANSAATLRFPEARYSMVRSGIALYGMDPSEFVRCPPEIRPALTFKTLVAQVKSLPTGSPISYGGTFVTERPSRIAVLPVGYGDGFRRSPLNWGHVLVRGHRAPIVGVVCMDMCMIDVTDIPGVRDGDEVVLIGRQNRDEITVREVAQRLGTIPYEVITQILARVPREVTPDV